MAYMNGRNPWHQTLLTSLQATMNTSTTTFHMYTHSHHTIESLMMQQWFLFVLQVAPQLAGRYRASFVCSFCVLNGDHRHRGVFYKNETETVSYRQYSNLLCQASFVILEILPKYTAKSVMAELKEMGLSWGEAQASAKDRTLWRSIVVALCPTGDEEDK